jgi:signal peptidase II
MILVGLIVLFDQVIKRTVMGTMPYGTSIPMTSFFNFVHVWNTGAAFSLFADGSGWQRYVLSVLGIGVSIFLAWLLLRGVANRLEAVAYTLIMGGALGNVADRIALGFVVDYLDFHWRGWHWPAFNLADIAITLGALSLIVASFREPAPATADSKNEDEVQPVTTNQVSSAHQQARAAANVRTALLLAGLAATFFIGIVIRRWTLQ